MKSARGVNRVVCRAVSLSRQWRSSSCTLRDSTGAGCFVVCRNCGLTEACITERHARPAPRRTCSAPDCAPLQRARIRRLRCASANAHTNVCKTHKTGAHATRQSVHHSMIGPGAAHAQQSQEFVLVCEPTNRPVRRTFVHPEHFRGNVHEPYVETWHQESGRAAESLGRARGATAATDEARQHASQHPCAGWGTRRARANLAVAAGARCEVWPRGARHAQPRA